MGANARNLRGPRCVVCLQGWVFALSISSLWLIAPRLARSQDSTISSARGFVPSIAIQESSPFVPVSEDTTAWQRRQSLRNSTGDLKWTRPQQVRMAEIHRDRPSFIPPHGAAATTLNRRMAMSPRITKAAGAVPLQAVDGSVGFDPSSALPLVPPNPAARIAAADDHFAQANEESLRLAQAQEPASGQATDANGLDDVLDQLVPEEAPNQPAPSQNADEVFPDVDALGDESTATDPDQQAAPSVRDAAQDEDLPSDVPEDMDNLNPPALDDDSLDTLPPEDSSNATETPAPTPADPRSAPTPAGPRVEPDSTLPPNVLDTRPRPGRNDDIVAHYNGRDCPAELESLQEAWDTLRQTPIRQISLDITPSIEPNAPPEKVEESRRRNMSEAPKRIWRDRRGRPLADGNMFNFKDGLVWVRDVSGEERRLSWHELSNDDLCFVSAWWELPSEFSPEVPEYQVRNWTRSTMTWTASALCHKPLYFEEVQLERYGHSAGPVRQAALSGAHFFGNIIFLPYHLGLNPPNECQYALGYYRPGSCAPWMLPAVPLSARAARMQIGALVGGLTLIP